MASTFISLPALTLAGPISGTVTANQGTSPWIIAGAVTVSNFPATVAVTQSTSPWVVSGNLGRTWTLDALTDSVAVSGSVTVSGTVDAAQSGAWTVSVDNFPATQAVTGPLTDTELRASPVPVSGTITANPTKYVTNTDDYTDTYFYVGNASPGTATNSASWQIFRISSIGVMQFADGNSNFDNVWDNRASLSYS